MTVKLTFAPLHSVVALVKELDVSSCSSYPVAPRDTPQVTV
jgi:hypothetical protein